VASAIRKSHCLSAHTKRAEIDGQSRAQTHSGTGHRKCKRNVPTRATPDARTRWCRSAQLLCLGSIRSSRLPAVDAHDWPVRIAILLCWLAGGRWAAGGQTARTDDDNVSACRCASLVASHRSAASDHCELRSLVAPEHLTTTHRPASGPDDQDAAGSRPETESTQPSASFAPVSLLPASSTSDSVGRSFRLAARAQRRQQTQLRTGGGATVTMASDSPASGKISDLVHAPPSPVLSVLPTTDVAASASAASSSGAASAPAEDNSVPVIETMDDDDFLASLLAYDRGTASRGGRSRSITEQYVPPPIAAKLAAAAGHPLPVEPPKSPDEKVKESWNKSLEDYRDLKASKGKWKPAKKVWAVEEGQRAAAAAASVTAGSGTAVPRVMLSPGSDGTAAGAAAMSPMTPLTPNDLTSSPNGSPHQPQSGALESLFAFASAESSSSSSSDVPITIEEEEAAWQAVRLRWGDALIEPNSAISGFMNIGRPSYQRGSIIQSSSEPITETMSPHEYNLTSSSASTRLSNAPRRSVAEQDALLRSYLMDLAVQFYRASSGGTRLVKHSKYSFPKAKLVKLNWETGILSWGSGEVQMREVRSMKLHRFSGTTVPSETDMKEAAKEKARLEKERKEEEKAGPAPKKPLSAFALRKANEQAALAAHATSPPKTQQPSSSAHGHPNGSAESPAAAAGHGMSPAAAAAAAAAILMGLTPPAVVGGGAPAGSPTHAASTASTSASSPSSSSTPAGSPQKTIKPSSPKTLLSLFTPPKRDTAPTTANTAAASHASQSRTPSKGHFLFSLYTSQRTLQLDAPTAFDRELWLLGLYNWHEAFVMGRTHGVIIPPPEVTGIPLSDIPKRSSSSSVTVPAASTSPTSKKHVPTVGAEPKRLECVNFEVLPSGELHVLLHKGDVAKGEGNQTAATVTATSSAASSTAASSTSSTASTGAGEKHSSTAPSTSTELPSSSPTSTSSSPAHKDGHSIASADAALAELNLNLPWWKAEGSPPPPTPSTATAGGESTVLVPPSPSFLFLVSTGRASHLQKHSRSGKPKQIDLKITVPGGVVSWRGKETLDLTEAVEIVPGRQTKVFERLLTMKEGKSKSDRRYFSIVMPTRTLDLEVLPTEEQKKAWERRDRSSKDRLDELRKAREREAKEREKERVRMMKEAEKKSKSEATQQAKGGEKSTTSPEKPSAGAAAGATDKEKSDLAAIPLALSSTRDSPAGSPSSHPSSALGPGLPLHPMHSSSSSMDSTSDPEGEEAQLEAERNAWVSNLQRLVGQLKAEKAQREKEKAAKEAAAALTAAASSSSAPTSSSTLVSPTPVVGWRKSIISTGSEGPLAYAVESSKSSSEEDDDEDDSDSDEGSDSEKRVDKPEDVDPSALSEDSHKIDPIRIDTPMSKYAPSGASSASGASASTPSAGRRAHAASHSGTFDSLPPGAAPSASDAEVAEENSTDDEQEWETWEDERAVERRAAAPAASSASSSSSAGRFSRYLAGSSSPVLSTATGEDASLTSILRGEEIGPVRVPQPSTEDELTIEAMAMALRKRDEEIASLRRQVEELRAKKP
jgi:hypothetical protein